MWVRWEAARGRDAVFVQDAEGAELRIARVVVRGEGEGVVAVQPAVVGVPAGGGAPRGQFRVGQFRHDGFGGCLCGCGHEKRVGWVFECK